MKKQEQARQTKTAIIETAADIIHINGFRSTSINEIIDQLNLTKGAFFHHFKNKKELGLAIIEYWHKILKERWVEPLETFEDPLTSLYNVPYGIYSKYSIEDLAKGCPLANLATELSSIDDDYREKILETYIMLEKGVAVAVTRGQELGIVDPEVDPIKLARFYEDLMAGTRSVAKNTLDKGRLLGTLELFNDYLESLKV
jgi:AcrR family transcriptional regulator